MPRIGAINRGAGLSSRNSENVSNATHIKSKVVVDSRTRNGTKRHADEDTIGILESNTKTRRRAALEEITNVSIWESVKLLPVTVVHFCTLFVSRF